MPWISLRRSTPAFFALAQKLEPDATLVDADEAAEDAADDAELTALLDVEELDEEPPQPAASAIAAAIAAASVARLSPTRETMFAMARLYSSQSGSATAFSTPPVFWRAVSAPSSPWPSIFIVGAPKAGTTTAFEFLAAQPGIEPPRGMKEPHFFSSVEGRSQGKGHLFSVRDPDRYLALWSLPPGSRGLDGSTSYLWDPGAAAAIADRCPDADIIVMVRDPVERAYSHYLGNTRQGFERRSFGDAVDQELEASGDTPWQFAYAACGRYAGQLRRFSQRFERVHLLVFEEFTPNSGAALAELAGTLGVSARVDAPASAENAFGVPRNALARAMFHSDAVRAGARRLAPPGLRHAVRRAIIRPTPKPHMPAAARSRLTAVMRDEMQEFSELLGRDLPWRSMDD
ncbi:MAG: sulfotransferase family protein [Gaiellales bacterium]